MADALFSADDAGASRHESVRTAIMVPGTVIEHLDKAQSATVIYR